MSVTPVGVSTAASPPDTPVPTTQSTGEAIDAELEQAIGMGIVGGGIAVFSFVLSTLQQNLQRLPPER